MLSNPIPRVVAALVLPFVLLACAAPVREGVAERRFVYRAGLAPSEYFPLAEGTTWTYDVRRNEWQDMQPEVQPPTDKNDAVLTYDPLHRVVLAIVKITTGKDEDAKHELQTWSYDAGANRWQRMNPATEPEPSSNRQRPLVCVCAGQRDFQ